MNYSEIDDPTWTITFRSVGLLESELAELKAWWSSLRGGLRSALVTQNVTCRPFAHSNPANAAPAQDTGTLGGIANGNVLTINGVSAGLILRAGDLLGLEQGAFRGLHRVETVAGAGTTRTVTVEPIPRSYVGVAGALVRFEMPELVMRPVPGSWSETEGPRAEATFSFVESWK
ncbi:hypothetical protein [Chelativorans sp.]|uniref:hypothetical protein n=1 Tax=Chelativorans sp. TaxID=2203393 RepID=UPI002811B117|nr:hypothetical protein [Chelativorans sp.]